MSQNISGQSFKALLEGDEKILDQIILDESKKLFANILRIVKIKFDAEEVLQDILLETWNRRSEFTTVNDLYSFMYSRVRFKSLDLLKKRMPSDDLDPAIQTSKTSDFAHDVHTLYEAKELTLMLSLAVKRMPEQRRKVFSMSYYDGMKQSEIASKLNISIKTVSVHMIRARKELKEALITLILFLSILKA